MVCKNCANPINAGAVICVHCGVPVGQGENFCASCAAPTAPGAVVCLSCGCALAQAPAAGAKSKMVAGLLGIFLGGYGIHNFYLGFTKKAVIQLVLTIVGWLTSWLLVGFFLIAASSIWGLVEGIMILTGKNNTDAEGNLLTSN